MLADQVVHDVKAAIDSGDTDLRLPVCKWDTVEAAWGQVWEKDWEAIATNPPRQCDDGDHGYMVTSTHIYTICGVQLRK